MKNNLKQLRERAGLSQEALASAMGTTRNQLTKLEAGTRRLSDVWIERAARALNVRKGELVDDEQRLVPIVGKAGAGPEGTVLFADGHGSLGEIPAPANTTPRTEALEVAGTSMRGIAEDGWIITYDEPLDPTADMENEPCVCWLEDGRVLVKVLHFGRGDGLFDLESANAPLMRDVPLEKAALVTNIIPRRAAQKFVKRNPHAQIVDVRTDGRRA